MNKNSLHYYSIMRSRPLCINTVLIEWKLLSKMEALMFSSIQEILSSHEVMDQQNKHEKVPLEYTNIVVGKFSYDPITKEELMELLDWSYYEQRKYLKLLQKKNFIEVVYKGIPKKRYIRIRHNAISKKLTNYIELHGVES